MKPASPPKLPSGAHVTTTVVLPADAFTITAALPEMLSQNNIEAVTGIGVRVYLETIRAAGFPLKVTKIGGLRLVDRAAFVTWLRSGAAASSSTSTAANDADDADEDAQLRAKIGLEAVPAPARPKRASAGGRA